MVKISDIHWGKYSNYEGPYYKGTCRLNLDCKNFVEKVFQVTSAAEGALDAVNMYDSAICTIGALQYIDRVPQFSVCEMLGILASTDNGMQLINDTLAPALKQSNATFEKNSAGKWRFFLSGNVEVNNSSLQQKLYFKGPNTLGSFTPERVVYAKTWAMCMVNLWQNADAQRVQIEYTMKNLLKSYIVGDGHLLFDNENESEGWIGAVRAAYVSFSVNMPSIAAKFAGTSIKASKYEKYSPQWCLDVIYAITFSGIKIWPQRYNNIRPELERLFGVVLPKNSVELSQCAWKTQAPPAAKIEKDEPVAEVELPTPSFPIVDEQINTQPVVNDTAAPNQSPEANKIIHVDDANSMNIVYAVISFISFIIASILKMFQSK
jgi:hypothetical protein